MPRLASWAVGQTVNHTSVPMLCQNGSTAASLHDPTVPKNSASVLRVQDGPLGGRRKAPPGSGRVLVGRRNFPIRKKKMGK